MEIYDSRKGQGRQEENESKEVLDQILRRGAQMMLQKAIEWEVHEYLIENESQQDGRGRHRVVRNGWREPRHLQTGLGKMEICQPRVYDKRKGKRFISNILPPYMRRAPSIEALVPALYLAGEIGRAHV